MKKNNILLYIFSFFAIFFIFQKNTYALENYSTKAIITYEETSTMNTLIDNTHTYSQFFQTIDSLKGQGAASRRLIAYLTDFRGSGYSSIDILMVKGHNIQPSFYSTSSNLNANIGWSSSGTSYRISFTPGNFNITNIYESDYYTQFYNCYVNDICTGDKLETFTALFRTSTFGSSTSSCNNSIDCYYNINSSNTNNRTHIITSELPLEIKNTASPSSSSRFYKTLVINGITYGVGDFFPTYFELFPPVPQIADSFSKQFDTQLNTLYVKVPTSNVSNININFSFNPSYITPSQYLQNLSWGFNTLIYGRVNHNNEYYSFEKLDCDFTNIDNPTDEFTNNFTFSGLTCNNVNLSNYDYIYFTLLSNYANWDSNLQKDIYGINLSTNYGNVMYRQYAGVIYEFLEDLPSGFNLFFSSKACDTCLVDLRLYSSTNTTWYSAYDITNLSKLNISNGNVQPLTSIINIDNPITELKLNSVYNLTKNYGYMIYNDSTNNNTPLTDLYIFIDENVMYSVKSNGVYHYYLPNTNTIDSSDITIDYDSNYQDYSTSFDLSAIVNSITDFINDINSEINEFSNFVQYCYNLLPIYCKSIIIALFNILLVKSIIKLIKGDFDDE